MFETFVFAPFIFLWWFISIFFGFTFTDVVDFIPLGTLVGGILAIYSRRFVISRYPHFAPRPELVQWILFALAQWPLLPHIALLFLALEARRLIGAWPTPMINDPKWMEGKAVGYDFWFHATNYAQALAGALMVVFYILLFTEWQRLSRSYRQWIIGISLASYLLFCFDPGRLYEW